LYSHLLVLSSCSDVTRVLNSVLVGMRHVFAEDD
jgi:hypothetical protein